ncbi:hypothetical protein BpHYR1_045862 [Brachionus plicatilis]|uniref:Uncharacterized protein n=1 Tax=Brachionus plicatilis TaxID=10195 RepID=A0A3M7QJM9_BRAPC|nr:hypothetical protein BpHYR1_045862 [Brachionus plicatilis]
MTRKFSILNNMSWKLKKQNGKKAASKTVRPSRPCRLSNPIRDAGRSIHTLIESVEKATINQPQNQLDFQ